VVGIPEPARALLELELAGLKLQRVYEHESRQICVRLAPEGAAEIDILGNELVEPPEYEPTVTRVEPLREALVLTPEPEPEVVDAEIVAEQPTVEIVLPPPAPAAVAPPPARSSRPLVLGALAAFFALFLLSRR
jgi:hypothetical protein